MSEGGHRRDHRTINFPGILVGTLEKVDRGGDRGGDKNEHRSANLIGPRLSIGIGYVKIAVGSIPYDGDGGILTHGPGSRRTVKNGRHTGLQAELIARDEHLKAGESVRQPETVGTGGRQGVRGPRGTLGNGEVRTPDFDQRGKARFDALLKFRIGIDRNGLSPKILTAPVTTGNDPTQGTRSSPEPDTRQNFHFKHSIFTDNNITTLLSLWLRTIGSQVFLIFFRPVIRPEIFPRPGPKGGDQGGTGEADHDRDGGGGKGGAEGQKTHQPRESKPAPRRRDGGRRAGQPLKGGAGQRVRDARTQEGR